VFLANVDQGIIINNFNDTSCTLIDLRVIIDFLCFKGNKAMNSALDDQKEQKSSYKAFKEAKVE